MDDLLKQVPKELRDRFTEIVTITDRFCNEHLNDEYKQLCREMVAILCRDGAPVTQGKAVSWASGIISALGWVNFLSDPSQSPHMRTEDVARALGVSKATMAAKSRVIRQGLDLHPLDPDWTLESNLGKNPLVWMVQDRSGLIHDLRMAPRHVQEEAYRRGLIPYVPADRPEETEDDE
jgi:hypothetical protein